MASAADQFNDYFLTHREVKEANPNWSDRMVDDYLALKQNLTFLADTEDSRVTEIQERIDALESLLPISVLVTADHITTRNEIITCENDSFVTITLNASPADQEVVKVKRMSARVAVDGSGIAIDGKELVTLNTKYTALTFVYVKAGNYWTIR